MIRSFKDKETEKVFHAAYSTRLPLDIQRVAYRRLVSLDSAVTLSDLRSVVGNRLEKLKGDRAGQYSIRINDQWRVCFEWNNGMVDKVELVDYH